ncbi:MAG: arginine deiminase-related protein [Pseudomonadota bacterium]|nr:arginine deiminase-related protein [Pseudomonadota bacterium]
MSLQPTYLMTDAAQYDVAYQINPWMRPEVWSAHPQANRQAAVEGSKALRIALEDSGGVVHTIAGVAGLPDLVFPANAGIVLNGKALVARFRHAERRGEEPHFLAAFENLKAKGLLTEVVHIEGCFQEGAGDCIWDAARNLFWVGSGPRSTPESVDIIARFFGQKVVHLPLATEQFYHLDTCFCPLSGGEILYYPPALTADALARLRELVPADLLIEATDADAAAFCVNAVCLDKTVVMAMPGHALRDRLAARGYEVLGIDLAPFILSGGGAFCMTLRLDRTSADAAVSAPERAELLAG